MGDIDTEAVKLGFDTARSAINTLKGFRELVKGNPQEEADLDKGIELAERELKLAEAQIAQALNYRLCRAHFPPEPMLKVRVEPEYVEEIFECPICKFEEPSPEHFAQRRRQDQLMRQTECTTLKMGHWMD